MGGGLIISMGGLLVILLLLVAIPAVFVAGVIVLAKLQTILFTTIKESEAIAIMDADQFAFIMAAFEGRGPRGFIPEGSTDPADAWEIILDSDRPGDEVYEIPSQPGWFKELKEIPILGDFFRGIYWIGLPPRRVRDYRFTWTSREQKPGVGGATTNILVTTEKRIVSILLREDMYAFQLDSANTKSLMVLDIIFVFRAQVINPYKALFNVEHWLETVVNRISQSARTFVASLSTEEINALTQMIEDAKDPKKTTAKQITLDDIFQKLIGDFEKVYGVKTWDFMPVGIDPSTEASKRARDAQTEVFVARREAEAVVIRADAEQTRIEKVYGTINSYKERGTTIRWSEAVQEAGLQTLAGTGVVPAININAQTPPSTSGGGDEERTNT